MPDSAHQSLVLDGLGGLIAVLAAVALAPAVVALSRRPSWASRAVAAAIPGAVLSIVALHLIPSSLETAGLVIVVPVVLGFVAPMGADVLAHRTSVDMRAVSALAMLLLALTPHFLLDGLALVAHHSPQLDETHDSTLRAAAIALHTLPLSAMLWMTARTAGGIRVAAAAMFYTAAATSLGFLGGGLFLSGLGGHVSAIFNAFVAGTLIHVSSHSHGAVAAEHVRRPAMAEWLGLACGVLLTLAVPHSDGHSADHAASHGHLLEVIASIALVLGLAALNLVYSSRRQH